MKMDRDGREMLDTEGVERQAPAGLRVVLDPYPHLRDDEGCILASAYVDPRKMSYILDAVRAAGGGVA